MVQLARLRLVPLVELDHEIYKRLDQVSMWVY